MSSASIDEMLKKPDGDAPGSLESLRRWVQYLEARSALFQLKYEMVLTRLSEVESQLEAANETLRLITPAAIVDG